MATITTINNGDTGLTARTAINSSLTNLNNQANTNTTNVSALTTRVTTAEGEIDTLQTDVTTLQAKELKRLASKTIAEINGELRDGFYTVASTLTAVNSGNFILVSDSGTVSNANCTYLNGKTLAAGDWVISVNVGGSQIWYLISNEVSGGGGSVAWGDITGTLSSQTDLQNALNLKASLDANVTFDSVQLNGGTGTQGTVNWNTDENTLDLIQNGTTLQLGQEIQYNVRNNTGSTIANGTPVMATGTIGASGRITIAPMNLTSAANAKYFLGVTTEEILNGEDGKVTSFGKVRQLDTTGTAYGEVWVDGDVIYLSTSTVGALTKVKPTSGVDIPMAFVIYANANGTLFVRANNGVLSEESYYNNTTSGLTATNVQDAIDEVVTTIPSTTQTDFIGGVIEAPTDQDYKLVVNLPYGATITETTTISTAGTCTATFKIGTTALGGTANSVSTTENSQTHSSANVASAGDDIVVTISSNSGCQFLSFTIKFTRTLS